jgi:quercetin dioxygenase-like cupin family protein
MSGSLAVVNVGRQVERLTRPFQVLRLEQIDDLAVDVYLCQGAMAWHRHVDEDELFLTYGGLITLESEWGTATLRPWEMALVPKGIGHRTLAAWSSAVLLLRPVELTDRKNGHRRLHGLSDQDRLRKVSLVGSAERPALPFRPQSLLEVEDFGLRLLRCVGEGPWAPPRAGDTLLLVQQGTLLVETEDSQTPLAGGELVRVPKHVAHRLTADRPTMVLEAARLRPGELGAGKGK